MHLFGGCRHHTCWSCHLSSMIEKAHVYQVRSIISKWKCRRWSLIVPYHPTIFWNVKEHVTTWSTLFLTILLQIHHSSSSKTMSRTKKMNLSIYEIWNPKIVSGSTRKQMQSIKCQRKQWHNTVTSASHNTNTSYKCTEKPCQSTEKIPLLCFSQANHKIHDEIFDVLIKKMTASQWLTSCTRNRSFFDQVLNKGVHRLMFCLLMKLPNWYKKFSSIGQSEEVEDIADT